MSKVLIRITLLVETNLDERDLERRLETFLDHNDLAAQLLGDETIEFLDTHIEVDESP